MENNNQEIVSLLHSKRRMGLVGGILWNFIFLGKETVVRFGRAKGKKQKMNWSDFQVSAETV